MICYMLLILMMSFIIKFKHKIVELSFFIVFAMTWQDQQLGLLRIPCNYVNCIRWFGQSEVQVTVAIDKDELALAANNPNECRLP